MVNYVRIFSAQCGRIWNWKEMNAADHYCTFKIFSFPDRLVPKYEIKISTFQPESWIAGKTYELIGWPASRIKQGKRSRERYRQVTASSIFYTSDPHRSPEEKQVPHAKHWTYREEIPTVQVQQTISNLRGGNSARWHYGDYQPSITQPVGRCWEKFVKASPATASDSRCPTKEPIYWASSGPLFSCRLP